MNQDFLGGALGVWSSYKVLRLIWEEVVEITNCSEVRLIWIFWKERKEQSGKGMELIGDKINNTDEGGWLKLNLVKKWKFVWKVGEQ